MEAELRFHAMGSDAHVVLAGARNGAVDWARSEIDRLEHLWSRFLPGSEISRINAAHGRHVRVSRETYRLIELAVEGWRATDGLFDPTVLRALEILGYDRPFDDVPVDGLGGGSLRSVGRAPGCADILMKEESRTVAFPPDAGFDPGGIGKGFAADLVAKATIEGGWATGACVNLGGDMRIVGEREPGAGPWVVAVESPFGDAPLAAIPVEEGAVATSSSLLRRWHREHEEFHHIVDPRTGRSTEGPLIEATVVTGEAWWAEVVAKATIVGGLNQGLTLLEGFGIPGLLVESNGSIHAVCGMETWLT